MKGPSKATGVGGSLSRHEGREGRRWVAGRAMDQLRPDVEHGENAAPDIKGDVSYCTSCHAIYHPKHWHLDEMEFQKLSADPQVEAIVCPSCKAIEQKDFHGELHLRMTGLERFKDQILNTAYNEEAHLRATNPHARIGQVVDRGDEIEIDTLNPFLAHRIARELTKAIHGTDSNESFLRGDRYARVFWGLPDQIEHAHSKSRK